MKLSIIFTLIFILAGAVVHGIEWEQIFDRRAFYSIMASGNTEELNAELILLSSTSISEKEAYEGALMMRKAGHLKKASDKLHLFKQGRIKLETALLKDSVNGEYHFLRLSIQEHAPEIVKYRTELETDKQYIIKTYKNLLPAVHEAIMEYSKNSIVLRPQDF